jgi:hypothetical protein
MKKYVTDVTISVTVDAKDTENAWRQINQLAIALRDLAEAMDYNSELQDIEEPEEIEEEN